MPAHSVGDATAQVGSLLGGRFLRASPMHVQSTHCARQMRTYCVRSAGESMLEPHPLHLHTATRGFLARLKLQPASTTSIDERSPTGWPGRERAAGGGEGRRVVARNHVSVGRFAGQRVVEQRRGIRVMLRVQRQT